MHIKLPMALMGCLLGVAGTALTAAPIALVEDGKTAAGVARELDIPVYQLYKWRETVEKKQGEAFPGHGKSTTNAELEELRRENRRLKEERDILKKSLVFFAREQGNDTNSFENTGRNSR